MAAPAVVWRGRGRGGGGGSRPRHRAAPAPRAGKGQQKLKGTHLGELPAHGVDLLLEAGDSREEVLVRHFAGCVLRFLRVAVTTNDGGKRRACLLKATAPFFGCFF